MCRQQRVEVWIERSAWQPPESEEALELRSQSISGRYVQYMFRGCCSPKRRGQPLRLGEQIRTSLIVPSQSFLTLVTYPLACQCFSDGKVLCTIYRRNSMPAEVPAKWLYKRTCHM